LDEVVAKATEILLAAGWKGILVALAVVFLYALVRTQARKIPVKPTGHPPPDPERDPDLPPAEGNWTTGPVDPTGGSG
jgi:cell division septation protein DedD